MTGLVTTPTEERAPARLSPPNGLTMIGGKAIAGTREAGATGLTTVAGPTTAGGLATAAVNERAPGAAPTWSSHGSSGGIHMIGRLERSV